MKVLVGTLYCGEGDFDECVKSIREQDYPLEHFVVKDMEEHLAHYELYSTMKRRNADVMVKVDADMVLKDPGVVRQFVDHIESGLLRVTYWVDDFFTNQPIQGIHAYSGKIQVPDKEQFCTALRRVPDRIPIDRKKTRRIDKTVALHCHYPNEKQSFHFGFHRYLKRSNDKCVNLYKHWKENDHPMLRMACLGMWVAYKNSGTNVYCYGDEFDEVFASHNSRADSLTYRQVRKVIKSIQ